MSAQIPLFYGVGEKNRILAAIKENNSIYLTTLRSFAREIALRKGEVCIDDVRRMIQERDFPMPKDVEMKCGERVFGVVFNTKDFEPVRQIESTRPERIKRSGRGSSLITVYRLKRAA